MTVEIKAPAFPESVADGVVSAWYKGQGDSVARDELLVEIETDKVVMEVVAPEPGVIEAIMVAEGETITSEALLATLTAGAAATQAPAAEVSTSHEADSGAAAGTTEAIPMGPAVRALLEEHMSAMTARTHEARQSAQNLEQFLKQSFLAAFTMIVEDPIFYKLVMRNEAVIREHYEDRILGVSMASLIEDVEDAHVLRKNSGARVSVQTQPGGVCLADTGTVALKYEW